jgi:hypothetical protein
VPTPPRPAVKLRASHRVLVSQRLGLLRPRARALCVADPIGYQDGDTSYIYTTNSSSADHVLRFSAPSGTISNITSVTVHIVAAPYNGGSGTVTMSFYNNGQVAGQGGAKTIASGSGYTELVSGVFYTSISDISNLTMEVSLTGSVKYTAIWLDLTYGPAGTTPDTDLENYMCQGSSCQQVDQSLPDGYDWYWNVGSCPPTTCAGGSVLGSLTVTPNATSPVSRNGNTSSTEVAFSAPAGSQGSTASALEWVRMDKKSTAPAPPGGIPDVASVTGDWWFYVSYASSNNPRSLEFDLLWGNGSVTAMWGTH